MAIGSKRRKKYYSKANRKDIVVKPSKAIAIVNNISPSDIIGTTTYAPTQADCNLVNLGPKYIMNQILRKYVYIRKIKKDISKYIRSLKFRHFFESTAANKPPQTIRSADVMPNAPAVSPFHVQNPLWELPSKWAFPHALLEYERQVSTRLNSEIRRIKYISLTIPKQHKPQKIILDNILTLEDTILVNTDKNQGLRLASIEWYTNSMLQHLEDTTTFQILTTSNIFLRHKLFCQARDLLKLHTRIYENDKTGKTVFTEIAKFILQNDTPNDTWNIDICSPYLLGKVHKNSTIVPSRLICPSFNNPLFYMSRYLHITLFPLVVQTDFFLRDTPHLLSLIKPLQIPSSAVFVTADVVSLYPSIDISCALNKIRLFLLTSPLTHCIKTPHTASDPGIFEFRVNEWLDYFHLILTNNYINFADVIYHQIKGTAMGTPVAVVFAVLFLASIESQLPPNIALLIKRFIDDIFAIFKDVETANDYIKTLVSAYAACGLELAPIIISESSVNVLDIVVSKCAVDTLTNLCPISTNIYRKPSNKYQYLPPTSAHSMSVHASWITSEINRIRSNCTLNVEYTSAKLFFKTKLLQRGYTLDFLNSLFATPPLDPPPISLTPQPDIVTLPTPPPPPRPPPPSTTPPPPPKSIARATFHTQKNPYSSLFRLRYILNTDTLELDSHANILLGTEPIKQPRIAWSNQPNLMSSTLNKLKSIAKSTPSSRAAKKYVDYLELIPEAPTFIPTYVPTPTPTPEPIRIYPPRKHRTFKIRS